MNHMQFFITLLLSLEIGGECLGTKKSDFLSTFFDVGGIAGQLLCLKI